MPSPEALAELIERGDVGDRAFVDALIRMEWSRRDDLAQRAELCELHGALQAAARSAHADLREQIAQGRLRGAALGRRFDEVPRFERDHFVEEALGIAYPPLEQPALVTSEHMTYAPSGYDEIAHALAVTELGPGDRFLDLGSGLGKVVMLAALLTGCESWGVECDARLCELGQAAAVGVGLGHVQLQQGDAQEASSAEADVVFMYLPFAGETLTRVMARLLEEGRRPRPRARQRFLCTGPVDTARYSDLVAVGAARSWLNVYAWR